MAMDSAMNLFRWDQVAVVLLTIFAVVIVAELGVSAIRKRVI
jgi:phosphonate transport system permease protein